MIIGIWAGLFLRQQNHEMQFRGFLLHVQLECVSVGQLNPGLDAGFNVKLVLVCNVLYHTGTYCAVLKYILMLSYTARGRSFDVMWFYAEVYCILDVYIVRICCSYTWPCCASHEYTIIYFSILGHALQEHTILLCHVVDHYNNFVYCTYSAAMLCYNGTNSNIITYCTRT